MYGIRTSRLRDRRKEERELLVKREFLQDMISENELLCSFLKKKLIDNAVLWEPDLLPSSTALHSCSSGPKAPLKVDDVHSIESVPKENSSSDDIASRAGIQPKCMSMDSKSSDAMSASEAQKLDADTDDDGDLPFDLSIDSGSLTCVACGILGFPFMAILQPSKKALEDMSLVDIERFKLNCEKENHSNAIPCSPDDGNSGMSLLSSFCSLLQVQEISEHFTDRCRFVLCCQLSSLELLALVIVSAYMINLTRIKFLASLNPYFLFSSNMMSDPVF